jgi:hypothetical protein
LGGAIFFSIGKGMTLAGGKSAMSSVLQMMDRFKVVEGIILIIAVWIVPHTHGLAEYAALMIAAVFFVALYYWWRRKGLFRKRG